MTELLRVYYELYDTKREYCVICLRSAQERRMVQMKSLENFIKSINLPFYYTSDFQKICFVCERAAAAAHRFRLAVNVSGSVHNLFSMMRSRRGGNNDITQQLLGQKTPTGVVRNAAEWQARVAAVRARSQLLQTEVLAVNSLVAQECPSVLANGGSVATLHPMSTEGDSAHLYVIPDATPDVGHVASDVTADVMSDETQQATSDVPLPLSITAPDVLAEPEIYMESVVIDDDERDPIEIKCEEPSLNEITIDDSPIHPQSLVPTGRTTHNVTLRKPPPTIVPIESLLESQNTSFLLHPIIEKNGVLSVPSLAAQIVNGQLITVGSSSLMVQTPKVALHNGVNFNLLTDPKQVADVLKNMNGSEISNVAIVSDDIPINVMEDNVMQTMHVNNGRSAPVKSNNVQRATLQTKPMIQLSTSDGQIVVNPTHSNILLHSLMGYTPQQAYAKNNGLQTVMADTTFPSNNLPHSIIIEDDESDSISDAKKRHSIVDMATVEGKRRQSDVDPTRSKRDGEGEKETPSQQRETDWEDKIPMDVISFMDATDPNAASVLASPPPDEPPLGVISEVHSITEDVHSENDDNSTSTVQSANKVHSPKDNASRKRAREPIVLVEDIRLSKGSKKNQPVSKNNQSASKNNQSASKSNQSTSKNNQSASRNNQSASKNVIEESIHQNVFSSAINSSALKVCTKRRASVQANKKDKQSRKEGDVIDLC